MDYWIWATEQSVNVADNYRYDGNNRNQPCILLLGDHHHILLYSGVPRSPAAFNQ